jgi:hypothetical protein
MSNLRASETGVHGTVIWIAAGEFACDDIQHGPRFLVAFGDSLAVDCLRGAVSVSLTDPPEVVGTLPGDVRYRVIKFVDLNRDALLRHWNGELATIETLEFLKNV